MKHLRQTDIDEFHDLLETEKAQLEEDLAAHGRVQNESGDWQGNSSGLMGEEADPNDAADQIEELVTNVPLVEELEAKHHDVEDAIEKIDRGTYGVCEECDGPIPLARIKVNPSARTCLEHAE